MSKRMWTLMAVMIAAAALWHSCNKDQEEGTLKLGIQLNQEGELKAAAADLHITGALVTIVDASGATLYDKEYLPVYRFGEGYTTSSLKIGTGGYRLEEFMLVDSSGTVLWATPRTGSSLEHLVSHPLPMAFRIRTEETTSLDIQVIRVNDYLPGDFGYVDFQIGFVETFCLKVYYSTRCEEEWNDSILGPDGTGAPIYLPMLSVWSGNRMVLHEPLNPGLNRYQLPLVRGEYLLEATDCHSQVAFHQSFTLENLLRHPCQADAPPLLISRDSIPEVIITPEGLTEPTIRQGIFGQLIPGLDDYMQKDSLGPISAMREVYFYPYWLMDSLVIMAPIDCHFPADLIQEEPVAIVLTNSEGYFQVAMDPGLYLYLVRDGELYYVDAYISSRRPGQVEVFKEEVTKLFIQLIDCSMWM